MSAEGEQKKSLFRAAGTVGFFTLLSRIFGFVRDIIIANYFGTKMAADAFFMAFRIPNLLRRLTAEGALSAAFVPVFTKLMIRDRREAFRLANNVLVHLTILTALITVLGIIFSPLLLKVIAVGFTDEPEKFRLTVSLTRWVFPYLVFVSLAAIMMGILNTMHHFTAPAAAPIMLNISFIVCTIFLRDAFDLPAYALAVGVLIGGLAQLAIQIPFAIKNGFVFSFVFDPRSEALKKIFILTLPATFGTAISEINMFVDTMLASLLKEGSVSFLYYANRLVLFPMGVIAVAMSTALLPALSLHTGMDEEHKVVDTLSRSMRATMFLILPSTAGLIILREPIVEVLFQRGAFGHYSTVNTGFALAFYSVGLTAFAGAKLLTSAYYALGDTKTPVKIAVYAMLINVSLNLALMGPLEHGGLALATSVAAWFNFLTLGMLLRTRMGRIDGRRLLKSFGASLAGSVVIASALYFALDRFFEKGLGAMELFTIIAGAAILYFVLAVLFGQSEAKDLTSFARKKLLS